ncbi:MAG: phosphoribosylformylglycinamidine synthase subunit PurQ [Candidatus Kapabacteria bacterium]|nr:phosphoribosylformylglycinamidine synthase subunit PurQ [Candidatus Kapabacteria bacterium]
MKFGVVVFPGSNCDHDAFYAIGTNAGANVQYLWHKDSTIPSDIDCIILPGGFSYGDYLRCGSIAKYSPIMREVINFASKGGYLMGICNGFQILTESGLLPGALLRNTSLNFACKDVFLRIENNDTFYTNNFSRSDLIRIPIAHGEGNYFAEPETIKELEDNDQVIFRYCSPEGIISDEYNPNGSINNIAGIVNKNKNILGLMPHPERYSDELLGCNDGIAIFLSLIRRFN